MNNPAHGVALMGDRSGVPASASPPATRSAAATLVFVVAMALAPPLFLVVPFRFLRWAEELSNQAGSGPLLSVGVFFIAFVSLVAGVRWFVLFALSFTTYRRLPKHSQTELESWPRVSVFIPAYNESDTIEPALHSLLNLDYPEVEVLVVDDGSTDDTFEKAKRFAGQHGNCNVQVLRKKNGGKWSAHNYAFQRSSGELILCLDADSRIGTDSLRRLVVRMRDPGVAAVAGQIRVRNRVNLLTRLQGLEYLIANGTLRMAQSQSGTVLVVPGPIGLFRRSVLEEVSIRYGWFAGPTAAGKVAGPFEGDTFAEDFDLSVAILALGGRIVYEPRAVSRTNAPDWTHALLNQRYRWARGTIQVLRKYFRRSRTDPSILHPRLLTWVAATYLLELLFLPIVYYVGIGLLIAFLASGLSILPFLAWGGYCVLLNSVAATLFALMHRDRMSIVATVPLYDLYHGFLLNSGWLIAVVDEIRGCRMRW